MKDAHLLEEFVKHKTHQMKMKMHDDGGRSPCLHCSCGGTWGATERAMYYLIAEHNYRIKNNA